MVALPCFAPRDRRELKHARNGAPLASEIVRLALLHIRNERPWAPEFQIELDELNQGALSAVTALGWDAKLVPTAEVTHAETIRATREADAVVLMGGEDLSPDFYGGPRDYPGVGHIEAGADAAQLAVVVESLREGRPVLGICRGNQVLNVALGGTLIQHLPTVEHHRGYGNGETAFVESRVAVEDELVGDGVGCGPVLCSHHQAIDGLGAGLRIAARAADGVIEAVVHESAPITGVQWHPEHPRVAVTQLVPLLKRLESQAG